jgi:hypothetical protein
MLATNYLINPALISTICGVSKRQARRYVETGVCPEPVRRLMYAHANGQLLGKEWAGWFVRAGCLYWRESSTVKFKPADLRAWWFERQELQTLRRDNSRPRQYNLL